MDRSHGPCKKLTLGDAISRFQDYWEKCSATHGFGGFWITAENAAIENKVQPSDWTNRNIEKMRAEFKKMGFAYDWKREFANFDPDYYNGNSGSL
ncbi:MAG: hypothetical protein CM1200mP12_19490 [Gammaproteobacteria bacterium]|nr:MAG: hypothetical protein CM1200mP12_19490 [Gammaproteobacteria bacterium]